MGTYPHLIIITTDAINLMGEVLIGNPREIIFFHIYDNVDFRVALGYIVGRLDMDKMTAGFKFFGFVTALFKVQSHRFVWVLVVDFSFSQT